MRRFNFIVLVALIGIIPTTSFGSWVDSMFSLPQKAQGVLDVYKRYRAGTASEEEILQVKKVKKIILVSGAVGTILVGTGVSRLVYKKWQNRVSPSSSHVDDKANDTLIDTPKEANKELLVNDKEWDHLLDQVKDKIRIFGDVTSQNEGCCGPCSLINIARMLSGDSISQLYGNKVNDIYESCNVAYGEWLYHNEMQDVVEKDKQFKKLGIRIFGGWNQDKFLTPKEISEIGEWVALTLFCKNKPAGFSVHINENHWVGVVVRKDSNDEIQYEIADSMNGINIERLPDTIKQVVKIVTIAVDEYKGSNSNKKNVPDESPLTE